jgi:hypothetical protein
LFDTAFEHRHALQRYDRVNVDTDRIHELAARGAAQGLELLRETLADAAESFARLGDVLTPNCDATPNQIERY